MTERKTAQLVVAVPPTLADRVEQCREQLSDEIGIKLTTSAVMRMLLTEALVARERARRRGK